MSFFHLHITRFTYKIAKKNLVPSIFETLNQQLFRFLLLEQCIKLISHKLVLF
jgi:hypothetical protein